MNSLQKKNQKNLVDFFGKPMVLEIQSNFSIALPKLSSTCTVYQTHCYSPAVHYDPTSQLQCFPLSYLKLLPPQSQPIESPTNYSLLDVMNLALLASLYCSQLWRKSLDALYIYKYKF